MKLWVPIIILASVLQGSTFCFGQIENLRIIPAEDEPGYEIRWKPGFPDWTGGPLLMRYRAYQSDDLQHWESVGDPIWVEESGGLRPVKLRLEPRARRTLYRIAGEPKFQFFDKNGETVTSYENQRAFFYRDLADLSVDAFEARYRPEAGYLDELTWDVTTAEFWDLFDARVGEEKPGRPADDPERRLHDFRLNDREKALMKKNGFVVTERHQRPNFVDMFYDIWDGRPTGVLFCGCGLACLAPLLPDDAGRAGGDLLEAELGNDAD